MDGKWALVPMAPARRCAKLAHMPQAPTQAPLIEHVRIAMSRRDKRQTPASNARLARRRRARDSGQMTRWENEGGALGHSAGQRPRPLP